MKLRLRLDSHPTFKERVEFPAIGDDEETLVIEFTFRHMSGRAYRAMLSEADKAEDQEKEWALTILKIAEAWDVEDVAFGEDGVAELLDRYHGRAGPTILRAYSKALAEGRRKNSQEQAASSTETEGQ